MTTTAQTNATLIKLSDTSQTISSDDIDVRGRSVIDSDGKTLGKVDDLLIDQKQHKVRLLRVEHGGFLGMGETKSFIPVDAITKITDDDVSISHSAEHVAKAPKYDPTLVDEGPYYDNLYGYYGYSSFWGLGYVYPAYLSSWSAGARRDESPGPR